MTLGQEFSTYAVMLGEDEQRLAEAASLIREINLGATAIGTGINAHPDYARSGDHAPHRASPTSRSSSRPTWSRRRRTPGSFVQLSGVLKRVAVKLSKICNDLRLLSSGPRAGIGEIKLPAVQAGSSIMPGKVNPVIPEVVNQIAFEVIGNDVTVTHGGGSRAAPAERLRADHRAQPVQEPAAPRRRLPHARRALRERHHGECRARAAPARRIHRAGHRAQPVHRLCALQRDRAGGAAHRRPRLRPGAAEKAHDARAARRDPASPRSSPSRTIRRCTSRGASHETAALFLLLFPLAAAWRRAIPRKPVRIICRSRLAASPTSTRRIIGGKLQERGASRS